MHCRPCLVFVCKIQLVGKEKLSLSEDYHILYIIIICIKIITVISSNLGN